LMVLRALAANDERIIEYFRGISQGRRPAGREDRVIIDVPEGLNIDSAKFVDSIELKLWSRLAKLSWRPFEEARAFVHGLHLRSSSEWKNYRNCQMPEKPSLPNDIPHKPDFVYKDQGWVTMGDWLGTGTISPQLRKYRPFTRARAFVRRLRLRSNSEWRKFCKGKLPEKGRLPDDIPAAPENTYKDQGWGTMGDWLGTGTIAPRLRKYRPFKQARAFARRLGLKSQAEWTKFCKGQMLEKGYLPEDIPRTPRLVYKGQGWVTLGDWLGTGTIFTQLWKYRPFTRARAFVRRLGLRSNSEWRKFYRGKLPGKDRLPDDIPRNPDRTYRDQGWISWEDWLGKLKT